MHRTSPKPRSLSVQRETLRVLAASELRSVDGGAPYARAYDTVMNVNCRIVIPPNFEDPGGSGAATHCGPQVPSIDIIVLPPIVIGRP
jgi:hypothetical protein